MKRQCWPAGAPVSERFVRSPSSGEPIAIRGDQHTPFHAGLDWGGASHALCVIDGAGQVIVRFDVRHDAAGLVTWSPGSSAAAKLPIAIEQPSGLTVDTLVEAGYTVVPIHPNVVNRAMPSCWPISCARTDIVSGLLCRSSMISGRCAPWPAAATTWLAQRVALANQLRNLPEGFWPGQAPFSPPSTARSRAPPSAAIPSPTAPAAWARNAWPASWRPPIACQSLGPTASRPDRAGR
ncbi:transposase [Mesorhizobium sp. M0579]|uniref:IS110 family transposase n=1 Tax=Mesorhizobium sp. M0579 TaxID=2956962 RepID=UPI00333B0EF7